MSRPEPGKLWGNQYPFERNDLQRSMTLTALAGVFAVTLILFVHADFPGVIGIALICGGVVSALAALSRYRYVQETLLGFGIVGTRAGGFVLKSSVALTLVSVFVAVVILRE